MKRCDTHDTDKVQRIRDGKKSGWYCRECANERAKAYRVSSPDAYTSNRLWTCYRIRLADFRRMLDEQGGACKVCREIPASDGSGFGGSGLVIDHDHTCCPSQRRTGAGGGQICGKCVRGLLCQQCNVALGMVNDDAQRLRALAEYVEAHQSISNPAPDTTASMPS
jgi:hypothetical protein